MSVFSKSFFRGFVGGFASPASLFIGTKAERPAEFNASVERAWSQVGRNLSDATRNYGESIGKAPSGSQKRRNRAA